TMIGWPMFCDTWSTTTRPVVSEALPAANGLMTRMGRVGHSWARAVVAAMRTALAPATKRIRMDGPPRGANYVVTRRICLRAYVLWVTGSLRKLTHRIVIARSAATKQSRGSAQSWIASSPLSGLLAMTRPYKMMLGLRML